MKANEIPCPYPVNFIESEPLDKNAHDVTPSVGNLDEGWPPKGHLQSADEMFYESVWNVPDGRRK
jgi:hypothetical protein